MISCHRIFLESRCKERGYTLAEAMPCVVSKDGDWWVVDVEHPAYPKIQKPGYEARNATVTGGPGTELKKLLAGWPFYITASPDCSCNRVAAEMDAWGPDECEKPERIDYVVEAMKANAAARGLPFVDAAGRFLVKRAIRNARRAAQLASAAEKRP